MTQYLKKCVSYVGGEPVVTFEKGDVPGHEFHGNQHTGGGGGASYASFNSVSEKYGVVMLDRNKASKDALDENARRNVALAQKHKEVAEYFGRSSFNTSDRRSISAAHDLGWN
jgi:hypothetical protein